MQYIVSNLLIHFMDNFGQIFVYHPIYIRNIWLNFLKHNFKYNVKICGKVSVKHWQIYAF